MTGPKIFHPEYYERMRALEAASWWNAGMRDVAERLLRRARLPRRGVLLDAGCGSGQTMEWFRRSHPEWRTVGVDLAKEGLRAARIAGDNQVLGGSVLALPLPDASVDAIISLDVLQHLPLDGGDTEALREFRRVLCPGGWLLVRTNAQSWPRIPDDPAYSFHKYAAPELREVLQAAGFRVDRLGRLNALLGLAEIPRELRGQRRQGAGYVGLLAEVPRPGPTWHLKRRWLGAEGKLMANGFSLPLGRTLLALAQVQKEASHARD